MDFLGFSRLNLAYFWLFFSANSWLNLDLLFCEGIVILPMCTKNHNYIMYGSWDTEWDRQNFLSFWAIFPLSAPENLENLNFNIEINTWRYYNFTHLHHKWQWYDVWFLRYEVQMTEFFVILDHFLPFYPLRTQKIKILKKFKKRLEILFFTHVCHKSQSYDVWFLRYQVRQT